MASPVRGKSGDRPLTQIPAALADTLASALRGGVKATLGMPGDIESIFRQNTALPTTADWDKRLPPTGADPGMQPFEKMGEFLPLPSTLGVASAIKQVKPFAAALRGAEPAVDMGRRAALQTMGKGAAIAAAATASPKLITEALRAVPEAPLARMAAPAAAKAATNLVSRAGLAKAAHSMSDMLEALHGEVPDLAHIEGVAKEIPERLISRATKAGFTDADLPNALGWMRHISGEGSSEAVTKFLDAVPHDEAMKVIKAGPDAPLPKSWTDAGVTTENLAETIFPIYPRNQPALVPSMNSFEKIGHPLYEFMHSTGPSRIPGATTNADRIKDLSESIEKFKSAGKVTPKWGDDPYVKARLAEYEEDLKYYQGLK